MAENVRDILFGLKVGYDEAGSEPAFKRLQDRVDALDARIRSKLKLRFDFDDSGQGGGVATAPRRGPRGSAGPQGGAQDAAGRAAEKAQKDAEKNANALARAWEKQTRAQEKELKKQEAELMKYWSGVSRKMDKAIAQRERDEKRATSVVERELKKQEAAFEKLAAAEKRAADTAGKERQRAISAATRQQEMASAKLSAAQGMMTEGFERTTEGVLKLGRGFAMLGLVGEKDTQKILEVMVKVQAAIDLTRGGMDLYRGLTTQVRAYREAVAAATAAEKALAAARGLSAGAGGAGAAGSVARGGAGAAPLGIGATAMAAAAALASVAAAAYVATDGLKSLPGGTPRPGGVIDSIASKEVGMAADMGIADKFVDAIEMLKMTTPMGAAKFASNGFQMQRSGVEGDLRQGAVQRGQREAAMRQELDRNSAAEIEQRGRDAQTRNAARDRARGANADFGGRLMDRAVAQAGRAAGGDDPKAAMLATAAAQKAVDQERAKQLAAVDGARQQAAAQLIAAQQQWLRVQDKGTMSARKAMDARTAAHERLMALDRERMGIVESGGQKAVQLAQQQVTLQQQLVDKAKANVALAQQQADAAKQGADAANTAADAARRQFEQAKGAFATDAEKFSKLEAHAQEAVKRAAEKLRSGKDISGEDEQRLEQFGEFREEISNRRVRRGIDAGAGELFANNRGNLDDAAQGVADADKERLRKNLEAQQAQGKVGEAKQEQQRQEELLVKTDNKFQVTVAHNENMVDQIMELMRTELEKFRIRTDQQIAAQRKLRAREAGEQASRRRSASGEG